MKRSLCVMALVLAAAACGPSADKGPSEEEMRAAASKLLQVSEDQITEFNKGACKAERDGFVCDFEMYIAFGETPSKQALDKGYFYKSEDEWVMELAM